MLLLPLTFYIIKMHLKTNVFFLLHGLKSEYIGVYKEANKNHPRTTVAHQLVPFWVCVDQCTGTAPARPALALRAFSFHQSGFQNSILKVVYFVVWFDHELLTLSPNVGLVGFHFSWL